MENLESNLESREFGLSPMALSAVFEIANIGLGHATTSLSEMTGRTFHMSIPNVESVPLERISAHLGGPETLCVGVFMAFNGDADGNIAFLFPWDAAARLWSMLLGAAPADACAITELEASAMLEIGNILNSSFLNAIASLTGLALHATPPLVSVEMACAVVQTIVVEAEFTESIALAIDTTIGERDGGLHGTFLCIPTRPGLVTMLSKLGIKEAA